MRRNKSMKMIIDTFERYYQNGTEAYNSHTYTKTHTHTHVRFSLNIKAIVQLLR